MNTIGCFRTSYLQIGFSLIRKVVPNIMCDKMIEEVQRMKNISGFTKNLTQDSNNKNHLSSNFFVDQHNRVSHFFENSYSNDQSLDRESIIKIGHALHTNKLFGQITFGKPIHEIQQKLGITDSLVLQSMILEKLPKKGGKVTIHQDSTYLYSEPDTVNGYWVPLQDVTKDNGCIWLIPGSHQKKLYSKFKVVNGIPSYDFDGPIDYSEEQMIPIQMEKGDLLIFHGRILHKSDDNISKKSRYAYTWHTMEKISVWSEENWISLDDIKKYQTFHI